MQDLVNLCQMEPVAHYGIRKNEKILEFKLNGQTEKPKQFQLKI